MATASYQCFFSYFGLRANPFHVSPDPRFYHATAQHESALHEFEYGLQTRQGLLVLTGEAGTGKTTLLNKILESLETRHISTAYVFHPLLDPTELLEFLLRDFGVNFASLRKVELLEKFQEWLIARDAVGDSPVVLIDEAQSLSLQALDELRLLLNLETSSGKLLQIILVGQSELEAKLRRKELRQLRQRVMIHCRLPVFSEVQTIAYIHTRLLRAGLDSWDLLPLESLQVIHEHARGIPRLINLLCEHALIAAYGDQQKIISPEIIERIAVDYDLSARPISLEHDYSTAKLGRVNPFSLVEGRERDASVPADRQSEHVRMPSLLAPEVFAAESVGQESVPEPSPAPHIEFPILWEPEDSPFPASNFLRRAGAAFVEYWRQVAQSFLRDVRHFARSLTLSTREQAAFTQAGMGASAGREPSSPPGNWRRRTAAPGRLGVQGQADRSSASK
jgi:general secretion pathway protein A